MSGRKHLMGRGSVNLSHPSIGRSETADGKKHRKDGTSQLDAHRRGALACPVCRQRRRWSMSAISSSFAESFPASALDMNAANSARAAPG
ncbi:hypothetical protein GCM10022247_05320 [Allokutzneria multivorans]|uniref:Uncharacterized protein n=1 Tax=Allokutzneria multivorans TaxID=1142134 RepID=A0ABP7QYN9_9PSEU